MTAAVLLPDGVLAGDECDREAFWDEVRDSKLLSPEARSRLAVRIRDSADVQVSWCLPEEIDRWNILHASMIAMRRALLPFAGMARAVLVDGNLSPFDRRFDHESSCEPVRLGYDAVTTVVGGDQRCLSIAAASVVAKVYRDEWMRELGEIFPEYGFGEHKGYSTPVHNAALARLGPCAIHRRSFAPVAQALLDRKGW